VTLLSRLAAQVPPPRFHVLSYFGVLASAASRRDEIVPGYAEDEATDTTLERRACAASKANAAALEPAANSKRVERRRSHPERMLWAELVQRVFLTEILRCPCGGRRRFWR